MTSFKAFSTAFSASVAIHAFLGLSLPLSQSTPPTPLESNTIQVDYVGYDKVAPVPELPAPGPISTETLPAAPRKKVKGIPVPRVTASPKVAETALPTDFQKIVDEKIKKQLRQIKRLETPSSTARVSSSMTSAELLSDPEKGRVFLSYFSLVKKKIQTVVYQKAGRNRYGRGTVSLAFVLNDDGLLEKVAVLPKGTQADELLKDLAVQCIREASPFGNFPKDLGPGRVVFNITIFFDGSDG